MNEIKGVSSLYGYIGHDEDKLAEILSKELEIDLIRDDDFQENEGPYIFFGKDKDPIGFLCIKSQFRKGDNWNNDYHKICPWVVEINFGRNNSEENIFKAKKIQQIMNSISEIKEMEFEIWTSPL